MWVQFGLAFFGLLALHLAMGTKNPHANFWAPYVGLTGQPFWLYFAYEQAAWGMGVISTAYTLVYLRAIWLQRTA